MMIGYGLRIILTVKELHLHLFSHVWLI